jgi:phosphatidylserine/phosphatidylglycerophosphate/cardiolipin synthase-like enzyme
VIQLRTLVDGAQEPVEIAHLLAAFLERAERTLDIAIYDINLRDETETVVLDTLRVASRRRVRVRLLYNVDRRPPGKVAPPPPKTRPEEIETLPFETVGVPGWPDLMHHKYVVRDGASVWTGSTNWTDDSWSREENVIAVVDSAAVADRYSEDFEQLWRRKEVRRSGKVSSEPADGIRVWFSPKRGGRLAHRIAHAIGRAERRVRIASPVVDNTQINEVLRQWAANPVQTWKAPALRTALTSAPFSGKRTTPYAPGSVHDYMHAKLTVCDDLLFVGSFNLSHSGESNAENVLEIKDAALAERLAAYVDEVRARYPVVKLL